MKLIICLAMALIVSETCHAIVNDNDILPDTVLCSIESNGVFGDKTDSIQTDISPFSMIRKNENNINETNDTERKMPVHNLKTDMSWASLPWIVAGLALRSERKQIRSIRQKFQYNFHSTIDDYLQYSPLLLTTGLKMSGVEGRSKWGRYTISATASYAVMALLVNGIKYSAREQRPDGSTYNSFPSGHTATAFAAATILHKEYGLTRSPWYSIGGYLLATATGCMRILNNRHWVSDTFAGAGIGILSTELGYTLADLLFKQKGLLRPDRIEDPLFSSQPSFYSVQMGLGLGEQELNLMLGNEVLQDDYDEYKVRTLKLSRAISVGSEGAYFFNRNIGVGGRLRVVSRNVKNWSDFAQCSICNFTNSLPELEGFIDDYSLTVESNHMAEFSVSGGLYLNFPLSRRLSIGSKLLVGRSYLQGIKITANVSGHQRDLDFSIEQNNGKKEFVCEVLGDKQDNGKPYSTSWDFLKVSGNRAITIGTGLSINFAYKSLIAWRLFLDYDFCHRTYFTHYYPSAFLKDAARKISFEGTPVSHPDEYISPYVTSRKHNISQFVLGAAFSISF